MRCLSEGWQTLHLKGSGRGPSPGSASCDSGLWLKHNTQSMIYPTVTPTMPPPPPRNSTPTAACTDVEPIQPGSRLWRADRKGGFSLNCCCMQKTLYWTHSGSQRRTYILHSALSLCHSGLWMSSLLGCGSVHGGGGGGVVTGVGGINRLCVCVFFVC